MGHVPGVLQAKVAVERGFLLRFRPSNESGQKSSWDCPSDISFFASGPLSGGHSQKAPRQLQCLVAMTTMEMSKDYARNSTITYIFVKYIAVMEHVFRGSLLAITRLKF